MRAWRDLIHHRHRTALRGKRGAPCEALLPDAPMTALAFRSLYIDGCFREAAQGRTFEKRSPTTGQTLCVVAHAGAPDVDDAVRAAARAYANGWGTSSLEERAALLERVAACLESRAEELAAAEAADTGKPLALARSMDIPRASANFRFFAQAGRERQAPRYDQLLPSGAAFVHRVLRKPLGVVAVICPWNLPLLLMTWKVAPALIAGNTVVAKASELTPSTATLLAEAFHEAGAPPGVFNVVHGFGLGSAGEALANHPQVRAITFTGSSPTGQAIHRAAAQRLAKCSLELGGKNPAIIFEDADLDAALAGTMRSTFTNCGQVCLCTERIYVQEGLYDTFREALRARSAQLRSGAPDDPRTTLGPLISESQQRKVWAALRDALDAGATLITGGAHPPTLDDPRLAGGHWCLPTLLEGLPHHHPFLQEEVFGPVAHLMPFTTEEEAIRLANDSRYGLCATVWTRDEERAARVGGALNVGMVWINDWMVRDLRVPFGGVGLSGLGREGGDVSLDFFTEPLVLTQPVAT